MKTFIVSLMSYAENEVHMKRIQALDAFNAVKIAVSNFEPRWKLESTDLDALIDECFNGDFAVGIIEI
jgi:hypothetical protein